MLPVPCEKSGARSRDCIVDSAVYRRCHSCSGADPCRQTREQVKSGNATSASQLAGTQISPFPQLPAPVRLVRLPLLLLLPAPAPAQHRMRGTTNAQRTAAAARMAARRSAATQTPAGRARANAIVGIPGGGTPLTLDQLYFSGFYPNYANSPLPNVADTVNCQAPNYCGMRKFVDTLPLLNTAE